MVSSACTLVPWGEKYPLDDWDEEDVEDDNYSDVSSNSSINSDSDSVESSNPPDRVDSDDEGPPDPEPANKAYAAAKRNVSWDTGETIRIRFLGGKPWMHDKVKKYARRWLRYANLDFYFVERGSSHIRISFLDGDVKGGGFWSKLGKDALSVDEPDATMNLAFNSQTSNTDVRRHVLHEFGHVLGLVHEHSSPASNFEWNEEPVYRHYRKTAGWSKAKVRANVFTKHSKEETPYYTPFDRYSIMVYKIPRSWTKNGPSIGYNTHLSEADKDFVAESYPYPKPEPKPKPRYKPKYKPKYKPIYRPLNRDPGPSVWVDLPSGSRAMPLADLMDPVKTRIYSDSAGPSIPRTYATTTSYNPYPSGVGRRGADVVERAQRAGSCCGQAKTI